MRTRIWTVGVFLTGGFVLFTAILFLIGNRHKAFTKHFEIYTQFSNLDGIVKGATVQVSGLDAGQVTDIKIPTGPESRFLLKLQLEQKAAGMIRQDSVASIQTEGVVGNKFVFIKKGSEQSPAATAGATIPSKESVDLNAMLEKSSGLLTDLQSSMKDIRGRADLTLDSVTRTVNHTDTLITDVSGNVKKMARDGSQITGNLNQLVAGIQEGKGPAGVLLKDEKTASQLRATLANTQQATANLNEASLKINHLVTDVQSRQLLEKVDTSLQNVQSFSQQLNQTLQEALAQDRIGETGATNLRNALSNLNQSTANLAEDTEALKHNFFFRGFFKKRGYYTLQDISANQYRDDSNLGKQIRARKWLAASEVFETGEDGTEHLSAGGRSLIDNTAAVYVGSLPTHPMIVEGYSTTGAEDHKYLQSRDRAVLVRHYLEQHFHVSHRYIGTVSLSSAPPEDAGIASWNGVCLVILD